MGTVRISYVVPAFNEQAFIATTLQRIHQYTPREWGYEIIVVDHGSTDGTVALAQAGGARVLQHRGGTVGELRNIGVRQASGEYIIFIDADVFLTARWARHIDEAFDLLKERPESITGSWYGLPSHPSWLERWWFGPLVHQANSHINSGHLIVTRRYFERLGGFDPAFETGEDFEFSMRVKRRGGTVVELPALHVEHHGYPKTLRRFIRREAWHGLADFKSIGRLVRSRVALITCGFVLCHVAVILSLAAGDVTAAAVGVAAVGALCFLASAAKYGLRRPAVTVVNAGLYYFYFTGRSLALWRALRERRVLKHQRAGG
jgi:glycosyltransferase involved in cell wall biosynthesis